MRDLVDEFVDALKDAAFVFVKERFKIPEPKQPRARRVSGKAPKAKKPKAERVKQPRAQEHTHYETLQVSRSADPEVVTAAWKAACRKYHPDTGHGNAKKMAEINAAYEILKDPQKRREYDASLRKGTHD